MLQEFRPDVREVTTTMAEFGLGDVEEVTMLGGWTNTNCHVVSERGPHLLKLYSGRSLEELQLGFEVAERLERHQFPSAPPLLTTGGDPILPVGSRFAMVYDFLPGQTPTPSAVVAEQIGRALAKLHRIEPPEKLGPFSWSVSAIRVLQRSEATRFPGHPFFQWLTEAEELTRLPPGEALPRGLVHADLFPDNTLFENGELVAILDFEEVCCDELLIDLSMAMVGFCWDGNNRRRDGWISALLDGYRDLRELTIQERQRVNHYVGFAALSVAAWRFLQFNSRYPHLGLTDRYQEMVERADACRSDPIVL
ncbi:MAG: phosphotransferase [Acidobacteriota bacterium]